MSPAEPLLRRYRKSLIAVLIFIAFPVIYTIWIGFTNFSSFNLLTYERTIEVLTSRMLALALALPASIAGAADNGSTAFCLFPLPADGGTQRYINLGIHYSPNSSWNFSAIVPYVERGHTTYGAVTSDQITPANISGVGFSARASSSA